MSHGVLLRVALDFVLQLAGVAATLDANVDHARQVVQVRRVGRHQDAYRPTDRRQLPSSDFHRGRVGVVEVETHPEQTVSLRGATVIAITHHRHVLELFDRVIEMGRTADGGHVVADRCRDTRQVEQETEATSHEALSHAGASTAPAFVAKPHLRTIHQIPILIARELRTFVSPILATIPVGSFRLRIPSCLLTLVLVPILFALALSISVPADPNWKPSDGIYGDADKIARLGFLAIISVVWMSASQSHLALARQRELYDHERSLGVGWACLLTSKGVVHTGAALVQTLCFLFWLHVFRFLWLERSYFVTEYWSQLLGVWLCLSVVAAAATALGLLVSALANRSPLTAAAVLPVLMMAQILFSVSFAVSDQHRMSSADGTGIMDGYRQLTWDTSESDVDKGKLPLPAASLISYFTLTRYGDQWLRSFAASVEHVNDAGRWQRHGAAGLVLCTIVCYLLALRLLQTGAGWKAICLVYGRVRGHLRLRSAPTDVLTLLLAAFIGLCATTATSGQTHADEPEAAQDPPMEQTWKRISLALVGGRYDANELRRQLGSYASTEPQWQHLDGKDVLALAALQLTGQIKFEIQEGTLQLQLPSNKVSSLVGQLAPCHLAVPKNIGGARKVIVFIHGLEGGASTFAQARQECVKHGIVPLTFDYPNDGPTQSAALALRKQLSEVSRKHPDMRLTIVAHSLGGLVAVLAVCDPKFPPDLVTDVFTLGTPFRGSSLADFQSEVELSNVVWRLIRKDWTAVDIVSDGRGEAADDIHPDSELLSRVRGLDLPKSTRFHLAAGSRSYLSNEERELLRRELPREMRRLRVSLTYAQKLEHLLNSDEVKDGQADGAVTIDSATALRGWHCKKIFEATHLELVSSNASDTPKRVFAWILQEMRW